MNEVTLFEMVCAEGNKVYEYRIHENGTTIKTSFKPLYTDQMEIKQSHGYCNGCLSNVYNKNGLIPEYKTLKKEK